MKSIKTLFLSLILFSFSTSYSQIGSGLIGGTKDKLNDKKKKEILEKYEITDSYFSGVAYTLKNSLPTESYETGKLPFSYRSTEQYLLKRWSIEMIDAILLNQRLQIAKNEPKLFEVYQNDIDENEELIKGLNIYHKAQLRKQISDMFINWHDVDELLRDALMNLYQLIQPEPIQSPLINELNETIKNVNVYNMDLYGTQNNIDNKGKVLFKTTEGNSFDILEYGVPFYLDIYFAEPISEGEKTIEFSMIVDGNVVSLERFTINKSEAAFNNYKIYLDDEHNCHPLSVRILSKLEHLRKSNAELSSKVSNLGFKFRIKNNKSEGGFTIDINNNENQSFQPLLDKCKSEFTNAVEIPKAKMMDKVLESQLITAYKAKGFNEEFKKLIISDTGWYIKKNERGNILYKSIHAVIIVKSKEGICEFYEALFKQDYAGGGNYEAIYFDHVSGNNKYEFRCEKLNQ